GGRRPREQQRRGQKAYSSHGDEYLLPPAEQVAKAELDLPPGEERRRRAEVGSGDRGHVADVGAVEQVEGLGEHAEPLAARQLEALLEPEVDIAVGLRPELVPRLGRVALIHEAVAAAVHDSARGARRPAAPEHYAG